MKTRRWIYAAAGVVVLLLAGLVYAWSVLSSPIGAYFAEWSKAQLSLTFTICMGFFCVGGFLGGLANRKVNVKIHVWVSAVLFFVGFYIASRAQSPAVLYLGYGVLCGFASGLVYNAVMSTVSAWFPDKQGLISGLLLMGFGISSFVVGKIYQAVTPSGPGIDAWRNSFFMFGLIILVIMAACGFFFVKPTEEELRQLGAGAKKSAAGSERDMTPMEMISTSAFWLYFAWAVLLSAAGLALISQASGVASEVAGAAAGGLLSAGGGTSGAASGGGVSAGTIATVVGLISIFNGIGRVIFGGMFDKLGRGKTMTIITAAFMVSVGILVLALLQKSFFLIVVGFICTGFSYGGINPTNSAFISAFFGRKNFPVNFSIINMNLLVSSFGSTIAGILYDKSGSFLSTFLMMIGAAAAAFVCSALIRKPK